MELAEISVKNFRGIGSETTSIPLDNIVVLIGPNNSGKSTILAAYEKFSSMGSPLEISDFFNEDASNSVEIWATFKNVTEEDINKIAEKWVYSDAKYGQCVKAKYTWDSPGKKGDKWAWDPTSDDWHNGGLGGWDSLLKSCLPVTLRINPLEDSKTYESQIAQILVDSIKSSLKEDTSPLNGLLDQLTDLTQQFHSEIQEEIADTCSRVSNQLATVFPGHKINFNPAPGVWFTS